MATSIYNKEFYDSQYDASKRSASVVLPIVVDLLQPKSIVDIGCGLGAWLAIAREVGITDVLGIDGEYVDRQTLQIPEECFVSMDFSNPSTIENQFDLAISLEVAEHIPKESAVALVDFTTSLAPVVLFAAAVPGQGGAGHVNEQWPDYWCKHFAVRGYELVDAIRPRIWDAPEVEPWYCQNSFLYVDTASPSQYTRIVQKGLPSITLPLRIVHPELFRRFTTMEYIPTRKLLAESMSRLTGKILRRRR